MDEQLSKIEKKVLAVIQGGMPHSQSPYKDMAEQAGVSTDDLLGVLHKWQEDGTIRWIGAIVNYFKVGFGAGAMVVWHVGDDRVDEVGEILGRFEEVTHAYLRNRSEEWPYSLYTMVHGQNIEEVEQTVKRMSDACGVTGYNILVTEKELKKVSPTYVTGKNEEIE